MLRAESQEDTRFLGRTTGQGGSPPGPTSELEEEETEKRSRNIHVVDQKEVAGNRPQGDMGLEGEGTDPKV